MPLSLNDQVHFIWNFGSEFLLIKQLENGKEEYYVWSDPDYSGDNIIRPFTGNPSDFTSPGFCGRDKGDHIVGRYCGENVTIIVN